MAVEEALRVSLFKESCSQVETTIDIPEPLYRQAERSAAQRGTSLKALVVTAIEHELREANAPAQNGETPYFSRRVLLPEYQALATVGAFARGTDSTQIISDERGV